MPSTHRSATARWRAALRAPLVHFLLLGGLLAALRPAEPPRIVIDAATQARLHRDFEQREARPPSADERDRLVDLAIDEAVLLRRAIDAGWLRHDGTVVNRLVQLGRFVGPEPAVAGGPEAGAAAPEPSPDEAVARARGLGLDRSDPVIRRYLLERARLAIASEADHPEPSEAELAAYLAAHAKRFRTPERLRLDHVFVSAGGGAAEARAAELASAVAGRAPDASAAAVARLADPSPEGRRVVASREELARRFGPRFAEGLDPDARGRWQGPLPSAHGLHLVWLHDPLPARDPALTEVRGRVRQALLQERRARHLRTRLDALRAGFAIEVE